MNTKYFVKNKDTLNSLKNTSHDINEFITELGWQVTKRHDAIGSGDISDVCTVKPLLMFPTSFVLRNSGKNV